ncbi:C4-dicarboxylate transporter DcuC [Spiroplasma taiwanense]|uniref:C4-dicarboxylate transporter DcuC n=1 Tax=Spiroplasma taiwanense TaxID=2145 RepID=UPI0009FDE59B|nr:C4-dicarboxylate transporter DcuC [Spiroplasma taiwanense]
MLADIFMYIFGFFAICSLIFFLIKKINTIIVLFTIGILLSICAMIIRRVKIEKPLNAFYPIEVVKQSFIKGVSGAGFIILLLGGYSFFMSTIQANEVVINVLTKPLLKIKKKYLLIPFVFLFEHLLSLAIPSSATLALILMATLFPVLVKTGISPLSAAAVIATTATIMPTPLGSDNVIIAEEMGISVTQYVLKYHAIISLPTILLMTFGHLFWQLFCDKRDLKRNRKMKFED